MSFNITPVILLILLGVWQHLAGITAIQGNCFPRIFGLNFLVAIDWFLFVFATFYGELGTGCYLLKKILIKTIICNKKACNIITSIIIIIIIIIIFIIIIIIIVIISLLSIDNLQSRIYVYNKKSSVLANLGQLS